jgi:hypothetical protein
VHGLHEPLGEGSSVLGRRAPVPSARSWLGSVFLPFMSGCGLGQRIDEGKGRDTIILQFTSSICPCCKRKNEAEQWAIAAVLTKMNDSSVPGNLNEMLSAHVKYNHDIKKTLTEDCSEASNKCRCGNLNSLKPCCILIIQLGLYN